MSDVESDLPEDLKNEASLRFQAAIDSHLPIGSATEKVQEEVLSKCNDVFKGKRYKGFIRFEYESNVITINVSLFSMLLMCSSIISAEFIECTGIFYLWHYLLQSVLDIDLEKLGMLLFAILLLSNFNSKHY